MKRLILVVVIFIVTSVVFVWVVFPKETKVVEVEEESVTEDSSQQEDLTKYFEIEEVDDSNTIPLKELGGCESTTSVVDEETSVVCATME